MNTPNLTRRQRIILMLKQGPISFMSIANKLGMPMKELKDDFEHISKSITLKSVPARCRNCDFVFDGDRKYKTPSKCPRCKQERIESQKFYIQQD